MKISFIMPAYNEERYIGKCLESIIADTRGKDYETEIIVADNNSTDKTAEVVRSFPEVKLVFEPEKGTNPARQAALAAATGDLIAAVDADTIIPAGWTDQARADFARHENMVALSGPYIYYDLSPWKRFWVRVYYHFARLSNLIGQYVLHNGAVIQGGNCVMRRWALESIGGFNRALTFYGDDTDLAKKMSKVGLVKFSLGFNMLTSGRRLKKEGLLPAAGRYVLNYLWIILFGRPFHKKNQDIRL